ncbi:transposase [Mesorhizobium sanjuanii]|uniref:transposase n=1 Tax=Mesorhizobium sanjuanii TaxID=2037900 RepID=UPI001AD814F8|nr:transposase [Mesorhizobium sanjuanii]
MQRRAVHPDGYAYSRFCDLFRGFERRLTPTMRQVHVAGDKVFVDYSGKKLPIVDRKAGEIREAEIFLGVLGASSYIRRGDLEPDPAGLDWLAYAHVPLLWRRPAPDCS